MILILDLITCAHSNIEEYIDNCGHETKQINNKNISSLQRAFDSEQFDEHENKPYANFTKIDDNYNLTTTASNNIVDLYYDDYDLNLLKKEVEIYCGNDDKDQNIELNTIILQPIQFLDIEIEKIKTEEESKKVFTLKQNQTSDILFDFTPIITNIFACEKKIQNFIEKIKNGINLEKERNPSFIENSNTNLHIKKYYAALRQLKVKDLYKLKKIQVPLIKKKTRELCVPLDVRNIIFEFLKILESFLSVYDMKMKLHKNLSNAQRINVHNFNINIFSLFPSVPMIETLELMDDNLRTYKYENIYMRIQVNAILYLIKTKLFKLSSISDKAVEIYKKLNLIYNKY
ncbi:uncharacterized protein VNE69_03097 [Vairimorpha necatrix]|uniref:Uncharacterized protein n=1 Tax=Vairimorpha necatrix TaxID=6039 RepID=A0AAX4JAD4_9MICR